MNDLWSRCQKHTTDLKSHALLYVLASVPDEDKSQHSGVLWVAWPKERWCSVMGLSKSKLTRAFAALDAAGLVVRERHLLNNRIRTFVRLSDAAKVKLF